MYSLFWPGADEWFKVGWFVLSLFGTHFNQVPGLLPSWILPFLPQQSRRYPWAQGPGRQTKKIQMSQAFVYIWFQPEVYLCKEAFSSHHISLSLGYVSHYTL